MRRYALRDDQWDRIKDFLPGREGHVGDVALYCERNLVERFFNKLKHFRAIATRYDKLARNFLAGVQLACLSFSSTEDTL
jgi:transposase